jgi:hypothetical protein
LYHISYVFAFRKLSFHMRFEICACRFFA